MDLEGSERDNTAKENPWLSNLSVWEEGSSAASLGKQEKGGLKETITCSELFVDGSRHLDVKVKVNNPDGSLIRDIHIMTITDPVCGCRD